MLTRSAPARGAMRLLLVLALVGLVAGCVQGTTSPRPADATPTAASLGYAVDCSIAGHGGNWSEPCLAFASPNDSPSKAEVDIAVNPKDPLNIVVSSKDKDPKGSDCVWAIPQVTKDGGKTWKTVYLGGDMASRTPGTPLFGWHCITDPIMVFDKNGVLYYSLQAYDLQRGRPASPVDPTGVINGADAGGNMYTAVSTDGGLTWPTVLLLHAGDGVAIFHDFMRMGVNPKTGTVYTIWNQYNAQQNSVPVLVAVTPGASSAQPPVYVPIPDKPGDPGMSGLAVAKDGTVYAAFMASDGTGYLATSVDDAKTFSTPTKFANLTVVPRMKGNNTFRTGSGFELAVDNSGGARDGWLYASYSSYDNGTDPNVYTMASHDKGKTWSAPVRVNQVAANDQWMPRPLVDARGVVHVVYFDRGYDPQNFGIDATWAASADGGASWSNTRLTTRSFDGGLGIHQDGFPFIGDYIGIASDAKHVWMGFPTTHTGRAEIAVAKVDMSSNPN